MEDAKENKKSNYKLIDLLKFICALLVIGIHTRPFQKSSGLLDELFYYDISNYAVPFFYACTGYFLIIKRPENDLHTKLILRCKKTLKIYLHWSAVYLPLTAIGWLVEGKQKPVYLLRCLFNFLFVGENFYSWTLWYLNGLIFALLLIDILNKKFSIEKITVIGFFMYFAGIALTISSNCMDNLPLFLAKPIDLYFSLFITTRNGLFISFTFVAIGMLIAQKDRENQLKISVHGVIFCGLIYVFKVKKSLLDGGAFLSQVLDLPIFLFMFGMIISGCSKINLKGRFYEILRGMSVTIYFVHMYFVAFCSLVLFKNDYHNFKSFFICVGGSSAIALLVQKLKLRNGRWKERFDFHVDHERNDNKKMINRIKLGMVAISISVCLCPQNVCAMQMKHVTISQFDSQSGGPVITEGPTDIQVIKGEKTFFEIKAEGTGLTYQWWWRRSSTSEEWLKYEVGKNARLEITPNDSWDGFQFRCVVTDRKGRQVTSEAGTVKIGPVIMEGPTDVQTTAGKRAFFEIKAEGTGLTYQWWWRRSSTSEEWLKYEVGKNARLEITPNDSWDGFQFRCVVTDQNGRQVTSEPGTVKILKNINPSISISCNIDAGEARGGITEGTSFTLDASVENTVSIQWQSSTDGTTFSDISGATGTSYTYTNSPAPTEDQVVYYRAVATSETGDTAVSNVVEVLLLSEDELPIKARPQSLEEEELPSADESETAASEEVSETEDEEESEDSLEKDPEERAEDSLAGNAGEEQAEQDVADAPEESQEEKEEEQTEVEEDAGTEETVTEE